MQSASNVHRFIAVPLAIAGTSALVWFGNGLNPWWPLMWLAPLPALIVALKYSWRVAAFSAFLAWLLGAFSMWHYLVAVLHAPISAWVVPFGMQALLFALAVLLFRALLLKGRLWSATFAFPAAWVSLEVINNQISPHGTAGSISYTQLKFLPILQLASITGLWGITFLLFLFPAAITIAIYSRKSATKKAIAIAGTALGLVVGTSIFGVVRLHGGASAARARVGLIASDRVSGIARGPESERLFRDYATQARSLAVQGAEVIVLPEKIGVVPDADANAIDDLFQSVADDARVRLVVGMLRTMGDTEYNQAKVYGPGVQPLLYNKQHMLPPFELDLKPGGSLTLLDERSGKWGVAICKDMDFRRPAADYGESGIGLALVPAWDFVLDRAWHGHMAIMRGVESGYTVVRAARNGFLTVSDSRGRILAERPSDSGEFSTLIADVPVTHADTLYLIVGDWFGWLCMGLSATTIVQVFRPRTERSPRGVSELPGNTAPQT